MYIIYILIYILIYIVMSFPVARIVSELECEACILRSIHSSGELIRGRYVNRRMPWPGCELGRYSIHESQEFS